MNIGKNYIIEQLKQDIKDLELEGTTTYPNDNFDVYLNADSKEVITVIVSDFIEFNI